MNKKIELIAAVTNIPVRQILNTLELFDGGATIPFVARYRKERTGGLDEEQLESIRKQNEYFTDIIARKETILGVIEKQDLLTDELKSKIESTWDANKLEDIYLPYKPKKRTRASIAKEKGLEPLADIIFEQKNIDIEKLAATYLNDKVSSIEEALAGVNDIIAEKISESSSARERVRNLFAEEAVITSKLVKTKADEAVKYTDYFEFSQKLNKCPSHRILAIRRAEKEGFLRVNVSPVEENAIKRLRYLFVKSKNQSSQIVEEALKDSYSRLIKPSIENEFAALSKNIADISAIDVFANNLRQLLLAPPYGKKRILGIDPGYRSGCKIVCIDEQGDLLHNETIYPHKPQEDTAMAMKKMNSLVSSFKIDAVAIGNGTASRETESFVKRIKFDREIQVFVVSEDGASVYSASSVAREEFPQYDVTVRGAVSIARRLMDPLAELVKIDPKSIGVGQYQHDVDQKLLKESLDRVVESAVNSVGVNLNTAGKHLLNYVSGLGPVLAKNIVDYRSENGAFKNRKQLMKVPRLGAKAFEQCAGFLRIDGGENPLDNTAVHPESYHIVQKMAKDIGKKIDELVQETEVLKGINLSKYITSEIDLPSLNDIIKELEKPGRDPRKAIKVMEFDKTIYKIEDLKVEMELPGIVTNLTNFGAFVDIGIKENGLVHISQICDRFISNPAEELSLHQHVKVRIVEIDIDRKRIQLSIKGVKQS
ncbi:MAG: Tex family protein [Bacteroidales bacterium]|nr:Tex family protein [Bacteroidales bacterium]MDD4218005.1 Tex family protein [Bacteroidales bacterium]MDY0143052.1 Tex family protein [Bacteroidales bacterium]